MVDLEQRMRAWLAAVSQRTGIVLQPDAQGNYGIACGGGLVIGVVPLPPHRVGLYAPVALVTDTNRAPLSRALLSRNLFSVHPHGAALGIDDDSATAYLCLPLQAEAMEPAEFGDHLGSFILAARALLDELNTLAAAAQDVQDARPAILAPAPWTMLRA